MKVIAKVDSSRVLCEVTMEELAWLNGFRNSYETGFNKDRASEVNSECNLRKMVATSQFVRSIRKDTLQKTKDTLEQAIAKIDETMETVASLELFNILSEEKQIGD